MTQIARKLMIINWGRERI